MSGHHYRIIFNNVTLNKAGRSMTLLIQELAKTELLQNVSDDLLNQVLAHARPIQLSPGELLLSPELDNHHIYLLLSGTLTVHFNAPDAPVIRELSQGYSVGEMSIIDDTNPSAYVKAKEHCRVFPVHRDFLLDLIQNTHPIAYNLLRLLTQWMKANTQKTISDQFQISELTNQANIDGLTGLYNRRWLDNALPRILAQMHKIAQPLCILIMDVDHFKKYNDRHGHQGGDLALVAMANVIRTNIRPYDFASRIGGEEFMVLLPNTNQSEGGTLAERIRQETENQLVVNPDGFAMPSITVSIGLAVSDSNCTAKSLFAAADKQLYLAKQSGRNCVKL
jgi:diguanylate cyclase (GGDEF)-like protein